MKNHIKNYPLSIIIILAIIYLSFFNPPQTEASNIPNIDKVAHLCMYGGLTLIIWAEYYRTHMSANKLRIILFGIISPIAMSGVIEIGQATLTESRSGDWLDFLANTLGVVLGALFSYYVIKPIIKKSKRNKP